MNKRRRWPLIIVALLLGGVVIDVVTVLIALRHADTPVPVAPVETGEDGAP